MADRSGGRPEGGVGRRRDRLIGVYIAVLAVGLAVCSLGGGNATKVATLRSVETTNMWAFFQAKNVRRQVVRVRAEEIESILATDASLPDEARATLGERLKAYREQEARLTSEPDKNEGMDELSKRAKTLEIDRDRAMRQDPYFDFGAALLQIAIVMASVAIISSGSFLLIVSGVLGVLGALLTINGFLLVVRLPFVG